MNINSISNSCLGQNITAQDDTIKEQSTKGANSSGMDIVEISSSEDRVFPCENYNNIMAISKDKIENIKYSFGLKIEDIGYDAMQKYSGGEISKEELKDIFDECCDMYLDMLNQTGVNSDTDISKEKAVMYTYGIFQYYNCMCSVDKCISMAREIAKDYGYTGKEREDFVYYDADIYYEHKENKETLTDFVGNMFSTYGLDKLNVEDKIKEAEDNSYKANGGITFHGQWSIGYARNGLNICSMTQINDEPPKGFKMFYKQKQNASIVDESGTITLDSQKGVLLIGSDDKVRKIDVPFNNSTNLGELAEFFNAGELYNKMSDVDQMLMSFLNHFNIYTRTYSFLEYSL